MSQQIPSLFIILVSGIAPLVFARPVFHSGGKTNFPVVLRIKITPIVFFSFVSEKLTKVSKQESVEAGVKVRVEAGVKASA
jgi:hypothetical protein